MLYDTSLWFTYQLKRYVVDCYEGELLASLFPNQNQNLANMVRGISVREPSLPSEQRSAIM